MARDVPRTNAETAATIPLRQAPLTNSWAVSAERRSGIGNLAKTFRFSTELINGRRDPTAAIEKTEHRATEARGAERNNVTAFLQPERSIMSLLTDPISSQRLICFLLGLRVRAIFDTVADVLLEIGLCFLRHFSGLEGQHRTQRHVVHGYCDLAY